MIAEALEPHHPEDQDQIRHEEMVAAHDAMLRASPAYFARSMLKGPNEAPYHGRFLIGRHHLEWDRLVMGPKNVCVLASRNLGKSYFFSLALPLYYAWTQPGSATFIISSTKDTVGMIMDRLKNQLLDNSKFLALLPSGKTRSRWNTTTIILGNGHEIHVASMNTKKRGFHPANIIGDDLLTDETAYSETIRRRQEDYWLSAVTPMLATSLGGKITVVGTPQSSRDLLMGNLRTNPAYSFRVYPGIVEGKPMWEKQLSEAWLEGRREEMGSVRFAREILCKPVASTSSLFQFELFQGDPVEQPGLTLGMPREHWDNAGITLYMGVDVAMSSEVGADYFVVMVLGIDVNGNHWLVDIHRKKGMSLEAQRAYVAQVGYKYRPALLTVETNQAQSFLADELVRTTNLPVVRHVTTAAKHSLVSGLPALKILFENRKLRIPRGDDHTVKMTDIFIDEFNNFTFLNGKCVSVGEHDDVAMAFWIATQGMLKQSFNVSFGPEATLRAGAPVPPTSLERAEEAAKATPRMPPKDYNPFGF